MLNHNLHSLKKKFLIPNLDRYIREDSLIHFLCFTSFHHYAIDCSSFNCFFYAGCNLTLIRRLIHYTHGVDISSCKGGGGELYRYISLLPVYNIYFVFCYQLFL